MNAPARFLVLFDSESRALLFDGDQHFLGEVIEDDGFIVESLLLGAKACPVPGIEMLDSIVPPPALHCPVRCFELV